MTVRARAAERSHTKARVTECDVYSPDGSPQTTSDLWRCYRLVDNNIHVNRMVRGLEGTLKNASEGGGRNRSRVM